MLATLLTASRASNAGSDVDLALCTGCVGQGPALEFLTWIQEMDLPDPEELLRNPAGFTLPPRGDRAYAVLAGVVSAAVNNLTADRWTAAWRILAQAADQGGADVAAGAARALAQAWRPELSVPTKEMQKLMPLLSAAGLR